MDSQPRPPPDASPNGPTWNPPDTWNVLPQNQGPLNTSSLPYRPPPDNQNGTTYPVPPPSEGITPYHTASSLAPTLSSSKPPPPAHPSYNPLPQQYQPHQQQQQSNTLAHASPIPMPDPSPQQHQQQQPIIQQPTAPSFAVAVNGTQTAAPTAPIRSSTSTSSLSDARSAAEAALREYMNLQRQRAMVDKVGMVNGHNGAGLEAGDGYGGKGGGGGGEAARVGERLREQSGIVLGRLRGLAGNVGEVVGEAEGQRWRRALVGGVFASIIPIVKALFRRPRHDEESSNDTEYAFKKSKRLISRILAATRRPGIATVAFFVFAVLYIFQNEVSLRVGRAVQKRVKRLLTKVEAGSEEITEDDLKLLKGWRWRVLVWTS